MAWNDRVVADADRVTRSTGASGQRSGSAAQGQPGVLRRPPPLQPGDAVAVIAPSGPVDAHRLRLGGKTLEGFGLTVTFGDHVLDRAGTYLAGTDAARAGDFERAWCDQSISAVLCARGGYGAMRILDLVDWDRLAGEPPKLFVGASDITALHEAIVARLGVATLFGPMVATMSVALGDEWTLGAYKSALLGDWSGLTVPADGRSVLRPGTARGITMGGNLSLLAATLGSATSRPAAGAIVLLEDVTEQPYRIDRLLTQLLRSGWFDGVVGVGLGTWADCGDQSEVDDVLRDRLGPLGVPVLGGLPFGHAERQASIPLGVDAVLDTKAGVLRIR
jgi:muramoyltetrapeptide carboxypeptidase